MVLQWCKDLLSVFYLGKEVLLDYGGSQSIEQEADSDKSKFTKGWRVLCLKEYTHLKETFIACQNKKGLIRLE